jgi:hypothetical protein
MAIRPANLRYEPRSVESLTAPEMRGAMRVLCGDGLKGGVRPESLSGVDKGRAASTVPGGRCRVAGMMCGGLLP